MRTVIIALLILMGGSLTHAAQVKTAQTVKSSAVKQQPKNDAKTLVTLPKDATVTVESRKKAWYQVSTTKGLQGWIKMLQLRFSNVAAQKGSGSLWNTLTTANSGTTASTGIRGFSEEDLKNAAPNKEAVKQLARFKASNQQVALFAKQGKLKTDRKQ